MYDDWTHLPFGSGTFNGLVTGSQEIEGASSLLMNHPSLGGTNQLNNGHAVAWPQDADVQVGKCGTIFRYVAGTGHWACFGNLVTGISHLNTAYHLIGYSGDLTHLELRKSVVETFPSSGVSLASFVLPVTINTAKAYAMALKWIYRASLGTTMLTAYFSGPHDVPLADEAAVAAAFAALASVGEYEDIAPLGAAYSAGAAAGYFGGGNTDFTVILDATRIWTLP
jgi:hypothetical protein